MKPTFRRPLATSIAAALALAHDASGRDRCLILAAKAGAHEVNAWERSAF